MGVLANGKHEAFARSIADGSTIVDAYEKAGYPRNRSNACRLRLNERIKVRIAELQQFRTQAVELQALTTAERAGVDAFWVLRNLRMNAVMAMRHGDRAAAARSIELIGKHLGLFVDKKQVEISYIDDADEYLAEIMAIVNAKTVGHEPLAIDHEPAEDDDSEH